MTKYTWNTSETAEVWRNATSDTIDECIEDAKGSEGLKLGDTIYVGECVTYDFTVDASDVLERIEEDAYDCVGEAAELWDLCAQSKQEDIDELTNELTVVVKAWMERHNYKPNIYSIENVRAVKVTE